MPQPIDPQTEIGRATAAERIQQIADRASLASQARTAEDTANIQRKQETLAQEVAPKSDEVNRENRRRNPFVGRRKKKRQDKEQGEGDQRKAHSFYNASEKEVVADDPQAHEFDVEI